MSQSRVFDIVLVALAIVILIHLFYNNFLFSTRSERKEQMANISFPTIEDVYETTINKSNQPDETPTLGSAIHATTQNDAQSFVDSISADSADLVSSIDSNNTLAKSTKSTKVRNDAHAVCRDTGPMNQTNPMDTPYYQVANKIIDNNSVNSDLDEPDEACKRSCDLPKMHNTEVNRLDNLMKAINTKECNIQSDGDNGYHRFCNSDPKQLAQLQHNSIENRSGSPRVYADANKLVFPDNYEGKLTSDPFDADSVQVGMTGLDNRGFLCNNPLDELTDVNGFQCEFDEDTAYLKRYIRDYVLNGKDQCYCATDPSKSEFTRSEIDNYREQQIRFRDKINGSSALEYDPVDKMNEITINGIKANKQSIADFYDSLVKNRYDEKGKSITGRVGNLDGPGFILGTSVPTQTCIAPPELDLRAAIPTGNYTRTANTGGRYFLRDNWMYNNENPNNGGRDCTGVTGIDPMMDPRIIIN